MFSARQSLGSRLPREPEARRQGRYHQFDIDPRLLEEFGNDVNKVIETYKKQNRRFAIVTSPEARPYVRMIVERLHPDTPVLSHLEIGKGIEIRILGTVS
jgi:flagellar biosynthesis protein FlhA